MVVKVFPSSRRLAEKNAINAAKAAKAAKAAEAAKAAPEDEAKTEGSPSMKSATPCVPPPRDEISKFTCTQLVKTYATGNPITPNDLALAVSDFTALYAHRHPEGPAGTMFSRSRTSHKAMRKLHVELQGIKKSESSDLSKFILCKYKLELAVDNASHKGTWQDLLTVLQERADSTACVNNDFFYREPPPKAPGWSAKEIEFIKATAL
jgi:hypothetical protein